MRTHTEVFKQTQAAKVRLWTVPISDLTDEEAEGHVTKRLFRREIHSPGCLPLDPLGYIMYGDLVYLYYHLSCDNDEKLGHLDLGGGQNDGHEEWVNTPIFLMIAGDGSITELVPNHVETFTEQTHSRKHPGEPGQSVDDNKRLLEQQIRSRLDEHDGGG